MSRIGNRVLVIPEGVTVTNENGCITVKGPKVELSYNLTDKINVIVSDNEVKVTRDSEVKNIKQMHGTTNSLIENMIEGVSKGYEKGLEINGVGYRFNLKGKVLEVNAGFSHKVELEIPEVENGEIEITNSVNYIYAVLSLEEEFEIEFDESYINGDFMHTVDQLEEIINLISK